VTKVVKIILVFFNKMAKNNHFLLKNRKKTLKKRVFLMFFRY